MNLFQLPIDLPLEEITNTIEKNDKVRVERIISTGQASPPEMWYDQEENELVVLLQGSAKIKFEEYSAELKKGDCINIPAHTKHRVEYTSKYPPCIWLCVFY